MKAAIESSKNVHLGMLNVLWSDNDPNRMSSLLHGFCMLTNMDNDEPEAYAEMEFLREFAAGREIEL